MKNILLPCGAVLIGLNAAAVYFPNPNLVLAAQTVSAAVGIGLGFLAFRKSSPPPAVTVQAHAPTPPPPRAEAEIVAFLALLQEHGRLVDFAMEDITGAQDAQLGAAARVVHNGCAKVLREYFTIETLSKDSEGTQVTLEAGYDSSAHRLLGSVPENPPYKGRLVHPGWIAKNVKLPRIAGTTDSRPWPVLAPAEVEIAR